MRCTERLGAVPFCPPGPETETWGRESTMGAQAGVSGSPGKYQGPGTISGFPELWLEPFLFFRKEIFLCDVLQIHRLGSDDSEPGIEASKQRMSVDYRARQHDC
mmetsp:Transcript_11007/g.21079  ORF Transcript_11007/g.21079 Transcript_11007/m.21079 type:complete len:104 (+) Transcript_11007:110-421(+)